MANRNGPQIRRSSGDAAGGAPPAAYNITMPMQVGLVAQEYMRASAVSYSVMALVNHLATSESEEDRLALAGPRVAAVKVLRAGYGSPVWFEVFQVAWLGTTAVGVAGAIKVLTSATEQLLTLPAKTRRAYLENRKLAKEIEEQERRARREEEPMREPRKVGPMRFTEQELAAQLVLPDYDEGGEALEVSAVPVVGLGEVVRSCDRLLSGMVDDGTSEFSTMQAVLRRARDDAAKGRMTNEVVVIRDLFAFVGIGAQIEIRSDISIGGH